MAQVQKLIVKFHVKFIDSEVRYHNDYEFNQTCYAVTNYPSYLSLEILQDKNNPWDPSNSVIVTQRNIFSIVKGLDKIIKNIYTNDIFAIKDGNIVAYTDEVKKNTVTVNIPFSKNAIMLIPGVIYDENNTSYEGATIYLNNTANGAGLVIDSLEALRDILSKVDFFLYSQSLVNYYLKYYNCNEDKPVQREYKPRIERNNVDFQTGAKVESNFVRNKSNDEFNNLLG